MNQDFPITKPSPVSAGSPRQWLFIGLVLLLSWLLQWSCRAPVSIERNFATALPSPIRLFFRDLCWITADEYLHFDAHDKKAPNFVPGSFGGNPDLIPLLRLCILFDPGFIEAWVLLAENQAFYFDQFNDGLQTLQRAIVINQGHPQCHELWAQLAYVYHFIPRYSSRQQRQPREALRALESALAAYTAAGSPPPSRPEFGPGAYHSLQARLLVDLGRPQEALAVWKAAGQPLDDSTILSRYLRLVESGGVLPENPRDLGELPGKGLHNGVSSHAPESGHGSGAAETHTADESECPHCSADHSSTQATRILLQSMFLLIAAAVLFSRLPTMIITRKDINA